MLSVDSVVKQALPNLTTLLTAASHKTLL